MRVTLISYHYYGSRKKAGFHFLAKEFLKNGHDVTFITGNISIFNFIVNSSRIHEPYFIKNILFQGMKINGVRSIININLFHPHLKFSKILNNFFSIFVRPGNKTKYYVGSSDLIIFEADTSVLLEQRLVYKKGAKKIYRISDDLAATGAPDIVVWHGKRLEMLCDLVSCPTQKIFDSSKSNKKKLNYHGVDINLLSAPNLLNPYKKNKQTINFIFTGISRLDIVAVEYIAGLNENYNVHIIGPFQMQTTYKNIFFYGYMNFEETIPYIKYADVGLHTILVEPRLASTMGDSLKVQQYSYYNLPIICPINIEPEKENFFYYNPINKESIRDAVYSALNADISVSDKVRSWHDLYLDLIEICNN